MISKSKRSVSLLLVVSLFLSHHSAEGIIGHREILRGRDRGLLLMFEPIVRLFQLFCNNVSPIWSHPGKWIVWRLSISHLFLLFLRFLSVIEVRNLTLLPKSLLKPSDSRVFSPLRRFILIKHHSWNIWWSVVSNSLEVFALMRLRNDFISRLFHLVNRF